MKTLYSKIGLVFAAVYAVSSTIVYIYAVMCASSLCGVIIILLAIPEAIVAELLFGVGSATSALYQSHAFYISSIVINILLAYVLGLIVSKIYYFALAKFRK
jgi:hypothetical protein